MRVAVLTIVTLSLVAATPAPQPSVQSLLRDRVKYVFVIYQENRSFDHYFGTYPGANGIYTPAAYLHGFTQYNPIAKRPTHAFRVTTPDLGLVNNARTLLDTALHDNAMDRFVAAEGAWAQSLAARQPKSPRHDRSRRAPRRSATSRWRTSTATPSPTSGPTPTASRSSTPSSKARARRRRPATSRSSPRRTARPSTRATAPPGRPTPPIPKASPAAACPCGSTSIPPGAPTTKKTSAKRSRSIKPTPPCCSISRASRPAR